MAQLFNWVHQIVSHFFSILDHSFFKKTFDSYGYYCASERVSSKSRSMISWVNLHHYFIICKYCWSRHKPSRQRLANCNNVWFNALMIVRHKRSSSSKSSLDFIKDHKNVVPIAKFSYFIQVRIVRNNDSLFSLNWLKHYSNNIWVCFKCFFNVSRIIEVN